MAKTEPKKVDISNIKNPEFLHDLNYQELELLSEDIRNYILDVTSKNGGHVSSNLGVVEATISLCRNFDFTKDKVIFENKNRDVSRIFIILGAARFDIDTFSSVTRRAVPWGDLAGGGQREAGFTLSISGAIIVVSFKAYYNVFVNSWEADIVDEHYYKSKIDTEGQLIDFKEIYSITNADMDYAKKLFLEAKIFDGKSFWEVEPELKWLEE